MISPGDRFVGYRGRSAHIADPSSAWLPHIASVCGQQHPRWGGYAALPVDNLPLCRACEKKVDALDKSGRYKNPFRDHDDGKEED